MRNFRLSIIPAVIAAALLCVVLPVRFSVAAEPAPVAREIIPGSELMTTQERERLRAEKTL